MKTPGTGLKYCFTALVTLVALIAAPAGAIETITYIHWDALGSPVAATDEDGNVVWREAYRPCGDRINNEAAAGPHTRWFTGHTQDEDTGLIYAGDRYYDPVIGRFFAIDPVDVQVDNPHSFNRYAYANNNPYVYVDSDGKSPDLLSIIDQQAYMEHVVAPQLGVDANTKAGSREIRKGIGIGVGIGRVVGQIAMRLVPKASTKGETKFTAAG